jgi:hypothetical protein
VKFFRASFVHLKIFDAMRVSENLSILFLLEKSEMSKDGRAPIYARITLNGQRKEISLGIKIFPEQWDQESSRVSGNTRMYF